MADSVPPLEIKITLDRDDAKRQAEEHADQQAQMVADVKAAEAQKTAVVADGSRQRDEKGRFVSQGAKSQIAGDLAALKDGEKAKIGIMRESMTSGQVLTAAYNQRIGQLNDARVAKALEGIKKEELAQRSLGQKIGDSAKGLGDYLGQYANFGTAIQVVNTLGNMWQALRDDTEKSVDRVVSYKEKLLELAALKDSLGNPDPVLRGQLDFRSKTLQTADQALTFQKGALNSGQAAIGAGFISKPELEKLMVDVGRLQGSTGVDPNALGNITGSLPMMIGGKNQTAESVFARLAGIQRTFTEGKQDLGPAIAQFEKNSSLIGPTLLRSPEEMAALQSALSLSVGDEAGTVVGQFVKATTGSLTASESSGGEDSIKAKDYLKGLGMTGQNSSIDIGKAISRDMQKEQARLKKLGQELNPNVYLATKGIRDIESVRALNLFRNLTDAQPGQQSTWDKTFGAKSTPASAPKYADAVAPLDAFGTSDVAGKRITDLARDQADLSRTGRAEAFYKQSLELAFQTERAKPNSGIAGSFEDWNKLNAFTNPWRGQILDTQRNMIEGKAKALGIPVDDTKGFGDRINDNLGGTWLSSKLGFGGSSGKFGSSIDSRLFGASEQERAMYYFDLAEKIRGKGGNPLDNSELTAEMKKNTAAVEKNNALMQQQVQAQARPAPTPIPPSMVAPGVRQATTR